MLGSVGVVGLCLFLVQPHYWDRQEPSSWTKQETEQFLSASPWAKQARAVLTSNESNMAGSEVRPRRSNQRSAGQEPSNVPSPSALPALTGLVRWVSAQPMKQILKLDLPQTLAGRYVLAVSGLPFSGETTELTQNTTLQIKRGEPVHPEIAYQDPADTSTVYFGFLPSMIDVQSAKAAVFSMVAAPYSIKVRFNPGEMKYHGELSF